MASIRKEFHVAAPADKVWAVLADFGAVDKLAPGFVTECRLDGDARNITFSNGSTARELLVDSDATSRRLVYAIVGGRLTHYSAAAQVLSEPDGSGRFVWVVDFLPNEFAGYIDAQMELGAAAMRGALEKGA
jgi:carbon monoxide dehydrogenase subunit G